MRTTLPLLALAMSQEPVARPADQNRTGITTERAVASAQSGKTSLQTGPQTSESFQIDKETSSMVLDECKIGNFTCKKEMLFIALFIAIVSSLLTSATHCYYNFSEGLKSFINDSDIRDEAGQYKINKIIADLDDALLDLSYDPTGKHSKANKSALLSLVTKMCASLKEQLPPDPSDQAAGITNNPNNVFASIGLEHDGSQYLHELTIARLEKMSKLSDNDVFLQEEFIGSIADLRQLMVDINAIVYRDGHSHTPKIFSHYFFQSISAILDVLLGGPQNNPLASIDRMVKSLRKDQALHVPTPPSEASIAV